MSFNAQSAIAYNNACNYPSSTIKIILDAVRAPFGYSWSVPGVTAVMQYQQNNGLDADGMVGLKSLNKMISDLNACGKLAEVSSLKQFIAEAKAKQAAKNKAAGDIVSHFSQPTIIYPFRFEKEKVTDPVTKQSIDYWAARGTFQVSVKLNPNLSEDERMRFEYRQFIKGSAMIQDGSRDAQGRWNMTQPVRVVDVGNKFAVPLDKKSPGIGLTRHYKEDGKIAEDVGSQSFRFGYRDGVEIKGNRFRNIWSPHPVSGSHLVLRDTPGYGERYNPALAPKIQMNFTFRGVVVEVEEGTDAQGNFVINVVREITDRTWSFSFQGALDWSTAVQAVKD